MDPGIAGTVTEVDGRKVTKLDAPKARLMSLIIDGILTAKLPWVLVLIGAFIALVLELCGVAALPFAVGVYLPLSTSLSVFVGGMVRWVVDRVVASEKKSLAETESSPGVLFSSGLIAGGALCGLLLAGLAAFHFDQTINLGEAIPFLSEDNAFAVLLFSVLAASLYWVGTRQGPRAESPAVGPSA